MREPRLRSCPRIRPTEPAHQRQGLAKVQRHVDDAKTESVCGDAVLAVDGMQDSTFFTPTALHVVKPHGQRHRHRDHRLLLHPEPEPRLPRPRAAATRTRRRQLKAYQHRDRALRPTPFSRRSWQKPRRRRAPWTHRVDAETTTPRGPRAVPRTMRAAWATSASTSACACIAGVIPLCADVFMLCFINIH